MVQGNVTDGDVTELVRSTADAASAYIRGDIRRYLTLIKHGDDYTLMAPYGGEPRRGFNAEEALESTPKMFRGGEADLELVETYASGDMAVLVAIERQHGEVGGMPDQDWSLRVTLVFRHEGFGMAVGTSSCRPTSSRYKHGAHGGPRPWPELTTAFLPVMPNRCRNHGSVLTFLQATTFRPEICETPPPASHNDQQR